MDTGPRKAIAEFVGADKWSDHDYALRMGLLDNYARALCGEAAFLGQRIW